jgi:hypothetical protein
MSWVDSAIEAGASPIDVDVSDLDLDVDILQVLPLSAHEFYLLKLEPDIAKMAEGDDRNEILGLRTVFEMLHKCDSTLSWGKFRRLPLTLLGAIATRCTNAVGVSGGGVVGE